MSKVSNKNKLIEKQLKQLSKKEEKLTLEKEPGTIKTKLDPLKTKLEDKIPEKLKSTLNIAFEKGFKTIFDKGMEFDINTYAINKYPNKKNLKKIDKSASRKILFNKSVSVIEGSALGLLGIGLPDIPIYIGVVLKSIYEISLSYGFDYSLPEERIYILNIICASVTSGNEKKFYFNKLDIIANEIDNNQHNNYDIDTTLKETCDKISTYMLTSKFIQGLPIVGVIGGITNFKTLQDISTIAKLKYKKRYLKNILL